MAAEFTVVLEKTVSSNQQLDGGHTLTLRLPATPAVVTYTATEVATGIYQFADVQDNTYRLYKNGSYLSNYGEFYIGDESPTYLANYAAIAENESITGIWLFDGTVPAFPKIGLDGAGEIPVPTNGQQFTPKEYVDDLYNTVIAPIQSTYAIKCLPTRSIEDNYSHTTMELCATYLAGLASITSRRGVIICEPFAATSNQISLDDGTSQWCGNGIDITGINKPRLNRRAPNPSLTFDTKITNCNIRDNGVVATRTYISFTFENCDIWASGTDLTFTNCKFLNCRISIGAKTLTMANCTGYGVYYNDDVTEAFSGTQPLQMVAGSTSNLGLT